MAFYIDRRDPKTRGVPSEIANDELQKFGWSAERFAEHERDIERAMEAQGPRIAEFLESARKGVPPRPEKPAKDVAEKARVLEQLRKIAGRSAEAAMAAEAAGELASGGPELDAHREAFRAAVEAQDYRALMDAYRTLARGAGEDPQAVGDAMHERLAGSGRPWGEIWAEVRGALEDAETRGRFEGLVEEGVRRAAKTSNPGKGKRGGKEEAGVLPRPAETLDLTPEEREAVTGMLRADTIDGIVAGYRRLAEIDGEDPDRAARFVAEHFPQDDVAPIKDFIRGELRARGVDVEALERADGESVPAGADRKAKEQERELPPNHDNRGEPIDVEILEPGAVLTPAAKRKMHRRFAEKHAAHEWSRTQAATEPATLSEDEAGGLSTRGANPDADAESLRQQREKMTAALHRSREGRRRVRADIDNPAFLHGAPMRRKDGHILTPDEKRAEGERLIREQLAAEADLYARIPAEGDDGSRIRAAVGEAAKGPGGSGGDAYEALLETVRREAPMIFSGSSEYTPETIAEIIAAVRREDGSATLEDLPEAFGVRQAVAKIREDERRARSADGGAPIIDADATVSSVPTTAASQAARNPWTTAAGSRATPQGAPSAAPGSNQAAARTTNRAGNPTSPNAQPGTPAGATPPPGPRRGPTAQPRRNAAPAGANGSPAPNANPGAAAGGNRATTPGAAPASPNVNPWTTAAGAGRGGAGGPPRTPAGGPAAPGVPPTPGGAPRIPAPAPRPGILRRVGAGALGLASQVGSGLQWLGKKIFAEPSNPGKENPFAKEKLNWLFRFWSWLWWTHAETVATAVEKSGGKTVKPERPKPKEGKKDDKK